MLTSIRFPAGPGTTPPTIRAAEPGDHDAIRTVVSLAYTQYTCAIDPAVWAAFRADLLDLDKHAGNGHLLVATVAGDVAGYAAFYPDASVQGLGWPIGWAGGRGLAVHPVHRGHGIAAALMAAFADCARTADAPAFAFHTSEFMTTARALYERLGYRRAPAFDIDVNAHYGIDAPRPWTALGYLKFLSTAHAA